MDYDDVFARLDEDDLQQLLGRGALRLIQTLDPDKANPYGLGELARAIYPPSVMLRDEGKRRYIIESLREDEAHKLASSLGLRGSSPWQLILRKRVPPGSGEEASLFSFFDLPVPPVVEGDAAPATTSVSVAYGLFPHQRRAALEVAAQLASPPHRCLLHMPTGSGKTRTTMHLVANELRSREGTIVIWLAFNEELCEQAATEFEAAWGHLGDRELAVHRFWGNRTLEIEATRDGFLVMGLQKAFSTMRNDNQILARLADRCRLVIFDEAHQSIAPTYSAVLSALSDRHASTRLLGLSATPGRTWNDPESDLQLVNQFAGNKVILKVDGYENPIDYLIDEGYLARPTFETLEHSGEGLSASETKRLRESLDIPGDLLERLATDEKRNLLIVDRLEQLVQNHDRIIVFAATVDHAYLLATVLQSRGIEAAAVTGATDKTERHRLISRFRSDGSGSQILCNFGVLTTGFDAPRTSAAIIARPTQSLVLYSQMVGRAIRGPVAGGNGEALIVTIVDTNLPGFGRPQDAFTNWEDVWND